MKKYVVTSSCLRQIAGIKRRYEVEIEQVKKKMHSIGFAKRRVEVGYPEGAGRISITCMRLVGPDLEL